MTTNTAIQRTNGAARAVADTQMLNLTLQETLQLGDVLTRSGYFKDVRDAAQAVVKILYGRELGIGPMGSMMGVHIIEGKPSPSATLMATLIKKSRRYNYRVTVWTDKECRIAFTERGEPCGESVFTWAEAQAAGVAGKDVWRKYPRAMLFARAMSQGARTYCADVFGGAPVYAAEELDGPTAAEDTVIDGQSVDVTTGEIIGESREVASDPAPNPDAEYRAELIDRLRGARVALGMSKDALAAELNTRLGMDWQRAFPHDLAPHVEYYERQAADVQNEATA